VISTIFGRRCIERLGWGQLCCTLLHASLSSFTRRAVVSVGGGEAGEWRGGGPCGNWTGASGCEGRFLTFVPLVRCNFVCSLLNFKLSDWIDLNNSCRISDLFKRNACIVCVLVLCITVYPVPGTVSCVPRAARVLSGYQWFTRTGFVWTWCQGSRLGLLGEFVVLSVGEFVFTLRLAQLEDRRSSLTGRL